MIGNGKHESTCGGRARAYRGGILSVALAVAAIAHPLLSPAASQFGGKWQELTELQRAEEVIRFGCMKGLVNELVKEKVSVTREYEDGDAGFRVLHKRYESRDAWVDLAADKGWSQQEDVPGYFTVRRAGIKNIGRFGNIAFLNNANRAAVRRFFLKPEFAEAMRTTGDVDMIPGGVAEVSFEFVNDRLRAFTLDCSL